MLIMAYLSILMFLIIAVLMLDVPYMERIGRSMQSNLDTASLSGAMQLTLRWTQDPPPTPNNNERLRGWRRSKRAVFAALSENPISSAEHLEFNADTPVAVNQDPLDLTNYGYEAYNISSSDGSGITANLTITRGVYHRPNNFVSDRITTFYRTERDSVNTWWADAGLGTFTDPLERYRCVASASPDGPPNYHQYPATVDHINEPTECLNGYDPEIHPLPAGEPNPARPPGLNGQSLLRMADSVQVTLTINNVPTLFGKLLGLGGVGGVATYNSITRTAVSVPE